MAAPMDALDGGCHCGVVRFRVAGPLSPIVRCNCSICRMKGFLHWIVEPDRFELLQGREALTEYRFGTRTAKHWFCRHCGVHPFYVPRSDPDAIDVNVRCLDGVDASALEVEEFDGARWDAAIATAGWKSRDPG